MTNEELIRKGPAKPLPFEATRLDEGGPVAAWIIVSPAAPPGRAGICSMWVSGHMSGDYQCDEQTWHYLVAAANTAPKLLAERDALRSLLDHCCDAPLKLELRTQERDAAIARAEAAEAERDQLRKFCATLREERS